MGLTHVTVRVWNLTRDGKPLEEDFLVDTGAVDCMANTPAILGVVALESAGFTVDGVSQTLKKIPAKPLKQSSGAASSDLVL